MKIHDIKIKKDVCDLLVNATRNLELAEETRGDRDGTSAFISRTKGGIKESTAVKDMNMFLDSREYLILKNYENHQESGYTNYVSTDIDSLVPDDIFKHFNLEKKDCRIDVKKSHPGKIHIPHKDYYINYKYSLSDVNGSLEFIPKKSMENSKVIRLWITLTEPRFGHILIVENKSFYWLEQGTIVTWEPEELHTAANLGFEDRFIMTITGSVSE